MARSSPWSVKGVDQDARQIAREAAKRHGLTIGAWVDRAIKARAESPASSAPAETSVVNEAEQTTSVAGLSGDVTNRSAADTSINETPVDATVKSFDVEKALKAARGETETAEQDDRAGGLGNRPPSTDIDTADMNTVVAASATSNGSRFSRIGLLGSAVVAAVLGGVWLYDNNLEQTPSKPQQIAAAKPKPTPAHEPIAKASTSTAAAVPTKPTAEPIRNAGDIKSLKQEAANGNHKAQFELANRYLSGKGVAKNPKQAVIFLEKAAVGGITPAQYNLGLLYETGSGVEKNAVQALSWYQKAASKGHTRAQHNLGTLYAQGKGTPKNYKKAAHWFGKGSESGLADSMFSLGLMHEHGLGVPKNAKTAMAFYNKALTAGSAEAAKKLKQTVIVAKTAPTPAEISQATATASAAGAPNKGGLNKAEVFDIQRLLGRLDLAPGTPDGVIGRKTVEAIKMYQRFAGLKVDGKATPSLLSDLRQVVGAMAPVKVSAPAPGDR